MATDLMTLQNELNELKKRVVKLEQANNKTAFNNSTVTLWREKPERQDTEENNKPFFSNYVNNYVFVSKGITNVAIAGQALGTGIVVFLSSSVVALWVEWSWKVPLSLGIISGTLVWCVLAIDRRGLLNKAIDNGKQKHKSLTLEVTETSEEDKLQKIVKRLNINPTITNEQLAIFAKAVLRGESMAIHKWSGRGNIFTQSQYQSITDQLDLFNYTKPPYSRFSRQLTKKGRRLMMELAKLA